MKQALVRRGKVIMEDVPAPTVSAGAVLVKVVNSCISAGTEISGVQSSGESLIKKALQKPQKVMRVVDMARVYGVDAARRKVKAVLETGYPTGYSAAGVIVEVGDGVNGFQVGDRVAIAGAGHANHAEFACVPVNLVTKMPETLGFDAASSVALGAIAMQGVRRADMKLGEYTVVIGCGILGLIVIQMLVKSGVRVLATDLDETRLALAQQLGAEMVLNPAICDVLSEVENWTSGKGADCALFTAATGSSEPLSQAFKMCRRKGKVVMVGVSGMEIKREDLYAKELDFLMATSYGPGRYDAEYEEKGADYPYAYVRWTEGRNMEEYLRLLATGEVDIEPIIADIYEIEDVAKAYEALQQEAKPLMILLNYKGKLQKPEKPTNTPKIKLSKHEKLRIGLIGAGGWATATHLPILQTLHEKAAIVGVCNRTGAKAKNVAREVGADIITSDPDDIIQNPDVDLVLIATRHGNHAELALKALRAGKHVFVEKPLAVNDTEANEIEQFFAEETGEKPLLFTGFNRRFSSYAREVKNQIADRSGPVFLQYTMNAGYLPEDHWVHDDGGRIIGEACHIVDLARYVVGKPVIDVAVQSLNPQSSKYNAADNKVIVLKYEDGSVATLSYFACGAKSASKEKLEVHFDQKTITMNNYQSIKGFGCAVKDISSPIPDKGVKEEWAALIESLQRSDNRWPIPLEEMLETTRLCIYAADLAGSFSGKDQSPCAA